VTEAFLDREAKPDIQPMFEVRDKKGAVILSTPNVHWGLGFGMQNPELVSFVLQHTCGRDQGTDCNCFILFSSTWIRKT
jgi:hypothetical protein